MQGPDRFQQHRNGQVSVRDHLEVLIRDLETRLLIEINCQKESVKQSLIFSERAIEKAEVATQSKFNSVNEFRGMVDDVVRTMMPRGEYSSIHEALVQRMDDLVKRVDGISISINEKMASGQGFQKSWAMIAAAVSMIGMLIATFYLIVQHMQK